MPKIAVPPATYPKEWQNWFLFNLGLKDNILEETLVWLKANSAYKCVDEHEPQPILDYEWDNKKKKIVMDSPPSQPIAFGLTIIFISSL